MRLKKGNLLSERKKITKEVASLEENEHLEEEIAKIEKKFFKKQMEIYSLDLKIVEEEENMYRSKLREMKKDEDDQSVDEDDSFFEAFEEQPEEFDQSVISVDCPSTENNEALKAKKEVLCKLSLLFRKRAWLRNKQVFFRVIVLPLFSLVFSFFSSLLLLHIVYRFLNTLNLLPAYLHSVCFGFLPLSPLSFCLLLPACFPPVSSEIPTLSS